MDNVGLEGRYQGKRPYARFTDYPLEGSSTLEDLLFYRRRLRESSHGRTSSVYLARVSMDFLHVRVLVGHFSGSFFLGYVDTSS